MRRLALAIALLAACGDDDSGGGSIPITGLEAAVIGAYCNLYVSCGLIDDATTCKSIYTDLQIDPSLVAAVQAGKVIYHPDKARACLNGLSGSCQRNALSGNNQVEACDQTFEGTVPANGQCAINEECLSHECNVPTCPDACCQGTCVGDVPTPRPHVGESCAMNFSCVQSFCDTTTMLCTAYRAANEPCTSTSQCANGSCTNQVCVAYPGPGEACGATTNPTCSELGFTCSTTSMTCVAYGLTGDTCTADRDCSPIYLCGTGGTCKLRPRLGEACGTTQSTGSCIDHSWCDTTTMMCAPPKADGGTCTTDRECSSNNCDNTTNMCSTLPICI